MPHTQKPANHKQRIVHLAMPQTDINKSQATNSPSCHASHRYQQITCNKSYSSPCLSQIPTNHRQQVVHLAMPHTDTSKSQATNQVPASLLFVFCIGFIRFPLVCVFSIAFYRFSIGFLVFCCFFLDFLILFYWFWFLLVFYCCFLIFVSLIV